MRSGTVILAFLPLQCLPFEYQIKFYDYSDYFFYPHRILKRVFISIIVQYTQFCSLFLPVHTGNPPGFCIFLLTISRLLDPAFPLIIVTFFLCR